MFDQSLVVSLLLFKKSKLSPSPAGLCRTKLQAPSPKLQATIILDITIG